MKLGDLVNVPDTASVTVDREARRLAHRFEKPILDGKHPHLYFECVRTVPENIRDAVIHHPVITGLVALERLG